MRQRLRLVAIAAVIVLGALALVAGPAAPRRRPARGRLALAPCQLAHPFLATRIPARCGTLAVPEDHDRPAGRHLSLRVAVIEAEAGGRQPDPVFFLAGGPGQAATEIYPAVADAFARVARKRDIVLVDQRGTGGSARARLQRPLPAGHRRPQRGGRARAGGGLRREAGRRRRPAPLRLGGLRPRPRPGARGAGRRAGQPGGRLLRHAHGAGLRAPLPGAGADHGARRRGAAADAHRRLLRARRAAGLRRWPRRGAGPTPPAPGPSRIRPATWRRCWPRWSGSRAPSRCATRSPGRRAR